MDIWDKAVENGKKRRLIDVLYEKADFLSDKEMEELFEEMEREKKNRTGEVRRIAEPLR